ncbi:MAG: DUF167 domain-containing protein [Candidatus Bilamarchaeum sp.]|jgi:uncharacterized protein (TIGR00251 family)
MIIEVNVLPNSRRFEITRKNGQIKIHLKSQPENNRANLELIKELTKIFLCDIRILSGQTSKRKKIYLSCSNEEFEQKIQITLKA